MVWHVKRAGTNPPDSAEILLQSSHRQTLDILRPELVNRSHSEQSHRELDFLLQDCATNTRMTVSSLVVKLAASPQLTRTRALTG